MDIQDQLARVECGLKIQECHLVELERRVHTLTDQGDIYNKVEVEIVSALRIQQANANQLAEWLHQARKELAR